MADQTTIIGGLQEVAATPNFGAGLESTRVMDCAKEYSDKWFYTWNFMKFLHVFHDFSLFQQSTRIQEGERSVLLLLQQSTALKVSLGWCGAKAGQEAMQCGAKQPDVMVGRSEFFCAFEVHQEHPSFLPKDSLVHLPTTELLEKLQNNQAYMQQPTVPFREADWSASNQPHSINNNKQDNQSLPVDL